jgi:hypothetical protein
MLKVKQLQSRILGKIVAASNTSGQQKQSLLLLLLEHDQGAIPQLIIAPKEAVASIVGWQLNGPDGKRYIRIYDWQSYRQSLIGRFRPV